MKIRGLVAGLAIAIVASSCAGAPSAAPVLAAPALSASGALGERSHEDGAVKVVASWIEGSVPSLRITLDTHSVDLDRFDLKQLARLRINGGDWTAPSSWDAPAGGHHRSGTLAFDEIDAQALASARVIELEVRDVAVPSHLLRWDQS